MRKSNKVRENYTVSEAAEQLGVAPNTVRRWANEGYISTIRTLGNHRRITQAELERIKQLMKSSGSWG